MDIKGDTNADHAILPLTLKCVFFSYVKYPHSISVSLNWVQLQLKSSESPLNQMWVSLLVMPKAVSLCFPTTETAQLLRTWPFQKGEV